MENKAFTLAEVLITLSIIGIVAALTIPSIIVKNQEKESVVRVKKVFNTLSNAYQLAVIEYGSPTQWNIGNAVVGDGTYDPKGGINIGLIMGRYMNIIKNCGNNKGCFPDLQYKPIQSGANGGLKPGNIVGARILLADGASLGFEGKNPVCTNVIGTSELQKHICAIIYVDINGFKGPNQMGKDVFYFYLADGGIIPSGAQGSTNGLSIKDCRKNGSSCSSWPILKDSLDYPPAGTGWDGETSSTP